jgi:hypothetical protein
MKKKAETNIESDEYRCEHCERTFIRPSTLLTHLCEQKRRWSERDNPANRIAFQSWLKFYRQIQPSKKAKAYTDFISNAYYTGFVKFGLYCVEVGVVNPLAYCDWLLKEHIALDNWNSDKNYTRYLIDYLKSEDAMDAVKRSVDAMLDLAQAENIQLTDVFKFINPNKICQRIINGKISPWILYQSRSGTKFLMNLNDDQRGLIYQYIDPERWNIKFRRDADETSMINSVIEQIGL